MSTGYAPLSGGASDDRAYADILGWAQYADAAPTTRALVANVRTQLTFTSPPAEINAFRPASGAVWWNQTTGAFQPDIIGGLYAIRFGFSATPAQTNRTCRLELDIGGSFGVILSANFPLVRGAGVETQVVRTEKLYALNTFVANGGQMFVTVDGACDVTDFSLIISKLWSP